MTGLLKRFQCGENIINALSSNDNFLYSTDFYNFSEFQAYTALFQLSILKFFLYDGAMSELYDSK